MYGDQADRWIKKMALEHRMIEPFEDPAGPRGVISYGLSSYGYDIRVADEFKIFNEHQQQPDRPKELRSEVVRRPQGRHVHRSAELVRAGAHDEYFRIPRNVMNGLPRQVHLCALRHHRQRHAIRAGVGRYRDAGDLEYDATAAKCTPTRGSRRCSSSRATRCARCRTPTKGASTSNNSK